MVICFLDLVYNKYKKHLLFDIGLLINTNQKRSIYSYVREKNNRVKVKYGNLRLVRDKNSKGT